MIWVHSYYEDVYRLWPNRHEPETAQRIMGYLRILNKYDPTRKNEIVEKIDEVQGILKNNGSKNLGSESFSPEVPPISLEDLGGLDDQINSISEGIIKPLVKMAESPGDMNRKILRDYSLNTLFFGPSGTGKTTLVYGIVNEFFNKNLEIKYSEASIPDLLSKWEGETEKNIKLLFTSAKEGEINVIFFDEIDALSITRELEKRRRSTINTFINYLGKSNLSNRTLLFGATNMPWDLDFSIIRRFSKIIHVPLPDKPMREQIIRKLIEEDCELDGDMGKISEILEGYSGSDIKTLLQSIVLKKYMDGENGKITITESDILSNLKGKSPSVDSSCINKYYEWEKMYGRN